jgi:hypothetical protein
VRKRKGGARTYRRDVLYEFLRNVVSDFDVHQGQWMLPGTDAVYKYTARRKKWKANSVELDHGAKGHWLGHSDAKYVMVYFHGKVLWTHYDSLDWTHKYRRRVYRTIDPRAYEVPVRAAEVPSQTGP